MAACRPTWRKGAQELEEERRLLYVAMTRARDHLHLLVPQRFYVTQQAVRGDRHLYAARASSLPPTRRFEQISWPPALERLPAVLPPAADRPACCLRAAWR